tara:strand:+ start:4248 stop:5687 length:1440 start_codon:yes stop_codon:yes gene_type:complete
MSDNTDFDVDNYSMSDLIHILKLQQKAPLTKADIIEAIENMVEEFEGQEKYIKFFLNVQSKLLEEKDIYTESLAVSQSEKDIETINEMHELIKKVAPDAIIQTPAQLNGSNNNNISETNRIISFDSHFRPMLDPVSVAGCPSITQENFNQLTHDPSDYVLNLSQPITNVTKIKLVDVSIPMSWYVFSGDYGTNYVDISINDTHTLLTIPEGNYDSSTIINKMNTKATSANLSIVFSYNSINGKISVVNNTGNTIQINWYYPINTGSCGYAQGQKMDYNLGWLLGFREKSNLLSNGVTLTASSILNVKGFDYLFISLDDFANNKPNPDLITNVKQKDRYKLPSYYNRHTMDKDCNGATFPTNCLPEKSGCGMVPHDPDNRSNLSQAQQFTIEQIKATMIGGIDVDRYGAPSAADLLAKLVVDFKFNEKVMLSDLNIIGERVYFAPVTFRKFKVKLLSKFGHVINLNERNWSFTIQTTENY